MVITDSTTRYAVAVKMRRADSTTIVSKLINIAHIFGHSSLINTDAGSEYKNKLMKQYTQALGLKHNSAPAFSHHCTGQSERYNFTLIKSLSHYIETKPQDWSLYVEICTYLYNITVHCSTGQSPHFLLMGYHPNSGAEYQCYSEEIHTDLLNRLKMIQDARDKIPEILRKAHEQQKPYYDAKRTDIEFKPGDLVLLKKEPNHSVKYSKFAQKYQGPYTIIKQLTPVTYLLEKIAYGRIQPYKAHVQNLKAYNIRLTA